MNDLGSRIKKAAEGIGGLDKLLSHLSDLSRRTLTDYVSGKSEPRASTVAAISKATGYRLDWLITGEGDPISEDLSAENAGVLVIQSGLMRNMARIAQRIHRDAGITLSSDEISFEAAELYNLVVSKVRDVRDNEEVEAVLPQIELALKRRLAKAVAQPGTGKQQAS